MGSRTRRFFPGMFGYTERDIQKESFNQLQKGISNIVNFILEKFHLEEAIICAARTAYLTRIIGTETANIARYEEPTQIRELIITNQRYNKFNRLKKSSPEAFFYWYHALL